MASPSLPDTMRAVHLTAFDTPYTLVTLPVPSPSALGPHDVLVKVAAASYCHTDGMVQAGAFASPLPLVPSHEGAGTVAAAGSASPFRPGDRVIAGLPRNACGACSACAPSGPEDQRVYCPRFGGMAGVAGADGFFAEYAVVDARWTTRLPAAVSFVDAAPLACAGRTAFRAVDRAGLREGQTLALVGSGGGLGHLAVQFARGMGLRVVGIDARPEGLALSTEVGAALVVDASRGAEAVAKAVRAATGGEGADAAVVLSDAADAAALACAVTRLHGTVVQVAQPDEIVIPFREIVFRDIQLKGSLLCSPEQSTAMAEFVAEHGVKVKTHVFEGLDRIGDLMELVHSGKIKGRAVIVVDREQV